MCCESPDDSQTARDSILVVRMRGILRHQRLDLLTAASRHHYKPRSLRKPAQTMALNDRFGA